MMQLPRSQNLVFHNPFPIQTVRGIVCTHMHFLVTYRKLSIFTDVGIQTNYIHIVNFLPLLDCNMFLASVLPLYKASRILSGEFLK
jgi:hypothetical protein